MHDTLQDEIAEAQAKERAANGAFGYQHDDRTELASVFADVAHIIDAERHRLHNLHNEGKIDDDTFSKGATAVGFCLAMQSAYDRGCLSFRDKQAFKDFAQSVEFFAQGIRAISDPMVQALRKLASDAA